MIKGRINHISLFSCILISLMPLSLIRRDSDETEEATAESGMILRSVPSVAVRLDVPLLNQLDPPALLLGCDSDSLRPVIFRPCGCERCDFQGYRGRLAIMEIMRLNADIDELIARRSTLSEIRQMAERQGFVTLADDGLRRVLDGSTSLEELGRVVDLTGKM